jgi:hypothetical protein
MSEQLGHLLTLATKPTISIGVIPFTADRSLQWPTENFWIFNEQEVSVELVSAWITITQPREITLYAQTFSCMAELAVYGAEARKLIADALAALD